MLRLGLTSGRQFLLKMYASGSPGRDGRPALHYPTGGVLALLAVGKPIEPSHAGGQHFTLFVFSPLEFLYTTRLD